MRALFSNSVFTFLHIIVGNIKKISRIRLGLVMMTFALSALYLISCSKDDIKSEQFPKIKTTVKGRVYDVERNVNIPNYKRHLIRFWQCTSVVQAAICSETIDSMRTGENGQYEFVFDYIQDGKIYGFEKVYETPYYHTEGIQGHDTIIPGESNIIDLNAWRPVFIRLNLKVSNNNDPPFLVDNEIIETGYFSFPQASIYEKERDTTVYLMSKPNSRVELNFHYSTGYRNGNYHSFKDTVQTTLQDTISFDYTIDCSKF